MEVETKQHARSIEPHLLGPLDEQSRPGSVPGCLFSGEERFLGRRERKRRTELWRAVSWKIEKLCPPEEKILYVAPAVQKVGVFQYLALGALVMKYHQVVLVLTDRRIVEVLLEFDGKRPAERVRSYAWGRVTRAKLSFGKLVLTRAEGKPVYWQLPRRGDRRLFKLLLPKIEEQVLNRATDESPVWPVEHCAACAGGLAEKSSRCDSCGTALRSKKLAGVLSLAFPGAGLFYAGHPVLGTFDLIGETMILLFVATMMLTAAGPSEVVGAAIAALFLIALTKFESLHIGHLLVSQNRTETAERHARWKRRAVAGGAFSILALVVVLFFAGALAAQIDRDLDFSSEQAWTGSRDASEWEIFYDDPDLRSQWHHADGWVASVFAYPLPAGETTDTFRREFAAQEDRLGANVLLNDDSLPANLDGFRFIEHFADEDETPVVVVHYFVHDEPGSDMHQVLMAVTPDSVREAEAAMRGLLARAEWIEATPPVY